MPTATNNKKQIKGEKEISVIGKDFVRKLRPHGTTKIHLPPTIMDSKELQRIKALLNKEKNSELNTEKQTFEELSRQRSERLQAIDQLKKNQPEENEMQSEDREKARMILEKAERQLEEEEDDIKKMNELILHAKCMAIREAQRAEKKMISEESKKEQARLDAMMEHERIRDIERIVEREKQRKAEMRSGASIIRKQIEDRMEMKILEAEKKELEAKINKKIWEEESKKEEEKLLEKKKHQHDHLLQVQKANFENIERKKNLKQMERDEDQKILQYILEKEKEEEEREQQEADKKAEKEKEFARLRALQQRMQDTRAEQDNLRAKRASEAYERERRKKEKEAAEKKVLLEKELREARWVQQKNREHVIAVEALKMKNEFYEMIEKQKEVEEKVEKEKHKKHEQNKIFAQAVSTQIAERERIKKLEKEKFHAEGLRREKEMKEKKERLENIKERKLNELMHLGIPEKYCNEIRRKMKQLEKEKISNQPSLIKGAEAKKQAA